MSQWHIKRLLLFSFELEPLQFLLIRRLNFVDKSFNLLHFYHKIYDSLLFRGH